MELRGHACFYFRFIPTLASLNEKHKGTQKQSTREKKRRTVKMLFVWSTNYFPFQQKNFSFASFIPTSLIKLCRSSVVSVCLIHLANLPQKSIFSQLQCRIWILLPIRRNQGQKAASQVAASETAVTNRKPPAAVTRLNKTGDSTSCSPTPPTPNVFYGLFHQTDMCKNKQTDLGKAPSGAAGWFFLSFFFFYVNELWIRLLTRLVSRLLPNTPFCLHSNGIQPGAETCEFIAFSLLWRNIFSPFHLKDFKDSLSLIRFNYRCYLTPNYNSTAWEPNRNLDLYFLIICG